MAGFGSLFNTTQRGGGTGQGGQDVLASLMAQNAMSQQPIRHPLEGIARLAQAFMASRMQESRDAKVGDVFSSLASAKPWTNPDTGAVQESTRPENVFLREAGNSGVPELRNTALQMKLGMLADAMKPRDAWAPYQGPGVPEGATAQRNSRTGQIDLLGKAAGATFGSPQPGVKPDGTLAYFQVDKSGALRELPGFQPPPKSGMSVTTPDGTVVNVGGGQGSASGLQKPTMNKVEEALLNTTERIRRVGSIADSYNGDYQKFGTRLGAQWTALQEKAGVPGFKPSDIDLKELESFSVFRRRATDDLTASLKEMSGAAVTPQEAERLLRVIPNPGTGITDGDSPTEFRSKMTDLQKQLRYAEARLHYIHKNGFDLGMMSKVPLDRVPTLIKQRAEKLYVELSGKLAGDELKAAVKERLANEFGLSAP